MGETCYSKKNSNCTVVTAGTDCSGAHHRLLHGIGVAFCHKIHVKVAHSQSTVVSKDHVHDDISTLQDINQPVLLEVQFITVIGHTLKVMFDNGGSEALITHSFAEKAGIKGVKVEYWLLVVEHESVLRQTMLYTFEMVNNFGTTHLVKACGIN